MNLLTPGPTPLPPSVLKAAAEPTNPKTRAADKYVNAPIFPLLYYFLFSHLLSF